MRCDLNFEDTIECKYMDESYVTCSRSKFHHPPRSHNCLAQPPSRVGKIPRKTKFPMEALLQARTEFPEGRTTSEASFFFCGDGGVMRWVVGLRGCSASLECEW